MINESTNDKSFGGDAVQSGDMSSRVADDKFSSLMDDSALLKLSPCCRKTVKSHVAHNPMMVCGDCKMMIKCFGDEKSFNNYVTFCRSRGRRITTVLDSGFYFVMFNNYPMSIGSG